MTRHNPFVAILHMRDHAREAIELTQDRTRADLDSDRLLNLALVRLVEVIGEAATRVPPEIRNRYPDVPWRHTTRLRNLLIHGYDIVDFDILWRIVRNNLPPLLEQLEAILAKRKANTNDSE